jgi:RES domain-containing protein
MTCRTKINLSYAASVASTATELTERNQAIRDHMRDCPDCQAEQAELRQAAAKLAARLQNDDGPLMAGEVKS